MPSIPGESASRSLASHHQSVTRILRTLLAESMTKAGGEASDRDIKDSHRVGKRGQVIIKFCKKKLSNVQIRL